MRRRMMASIGGAKPLTNPYITDGLVAMWDADWNVGFNEHSNSTLICKDLSGNGYDLTVNDGSRFSWGENYRASRTVGTGPTTCMMFLDDVEASSKITQDISHIEIMCGDWVRGQYIFTSTSQYRRVMTTSNGGVFSFGRGTPVVNVTEDRNALYVNYEPIKPEYVGDDTRVFVNGELAEITSTFVTNSTAGEMITIGGIQQNYQMYYGKWFFTRLYSRHLSDAEIAHNYAIDKERFGLP